MSSIQNTISLPPLSARNSASSTGGSTVGNTPKRTFAKTLSAAQGNQQPLEMTKTGVSKSAEAQINKAATEFESFFIFQMLELTAPEQPKEFGGGFAEEQFSKMKNEFLADEMAKKRMFGIGNHVYDQLMRKQLGN